MNDLTILVRSRMRVPLPLAKTNADLGEICEQVMEELKTAHADTLFELEKNGDLNGNWDQERLAEVVFNLAVNAIVHASAKQVRVTAEAQGPDVVL